MASEMNAPGGEGDVTRWNDDATAADGQTTAGDGLWLRSAMLGFATGLRSATPIGLLSQALAERRQVPDMGDLQLLATPGAALALRVAGLGEMVVDKLPIAPSRLKPAALSGRLGVAGFVGYLLAKSEGKDPLGPAMVAAAAGLMGALLGYVWRVQGAKITGLPDWPLALAEDAATYVIARAAVREQG